MKRSLVIAIFLSLAALCSTEALAAPAPKGWEPVKTERADAKAVARESDIVIKTFAGGLQVTIGHASPIKVFTILGQLVSTDTLPVGTSQLLLPQKGMYIVKIGERTFKVVI